MLLWSDDVNFFAVVDCFANEGHILKTKKCDVASHELFRPTKSILSLPIKGTLTEDRSKKAAIWKMLLNLVEDFCSSVSW